MTSATLHALVVEAAAWDGAAPNVGGPAAPQVATETTVLLAIHMDCIERRPHQAAHSDDAAGEGNLPLTEAQVELTGARKPRKPQKPWTSPNGLLKNEAAAAEYLGYSTSTLRAWRASGKGPTHVGGKDPGHAGLSEVRYWTLHLDEFLEQHTMLRLPDCARPR